MLTQTEPLTILSLILRSHSGHVQSLTQSPRGPRIWKIASFPPSLYFFSVSGAKLIKLLIVGVESSRRVNILSPFVNLGIFYSFPLRFPLPKGRIKQLRGITNLYKLFILMFSFYPKNLRSEISKMFK